MKINKYPDGTSYVIEEDFLPTITFKINNYEDLHHLEQYVDVCNYNGYTPTIVVPNLIDSQADKRFERNQSSGLKIVCKRLNSMNANFRIFHPHNSEVVEALIDNVEIIDNSEFISKVLAFLPNVLSVFNYKNYISEYLNLTILSPDAGMYKYMGKICDKINWKSDFISASKIRKYENNKSNLIQQLPDYDFKNKDIIVTDDISVYGGTFKGLSKLLKDRNCGKLYLAVSHMTVQNLGKDPVTNYFDKVFVTNSKFDNYFDDRGNQPDNLNIIKLF